MRLVLRSTRKPSSQAEEVKLPVNNKKRSFDQFAKRLPPFKWGGPYAHFNDPSATSKPERKHNVVDGDNNESRDRRTIGKLLAAGSDIAQINGKISQLTNDIHPIFSDKNICTCKYRRIGTCMSPHFVDHPEDLVGQPEAPGIASALTANNFFTRIVMQLASHIIFHEDTLPFWAGLFACAMGPDENKDTFHAHPRKRLNQLSKKDTLRRLEDFSKRVRIHFKEMEIETEEGVEISKINGTTCAYMTEPDDSYYDPAKDVELCTCGKGPLCDEPGRGRPDFYAFRDGKATVEPGQFNHIEINAAAFMEYDWEEFKNSTISEIRACMFGMAITLGHELSHAIMNDWMWPREDAYFGTDQVCETGFSFENFVFGGMVSQANEAVDCPRSDLMLMPFPNTGILDLYTKRKFSICSRYVGTVKEERCDIIEPHRFHRFFDQSWWDKKETDSFRLKKMWLKPYYEVPVQEEEYLKYSTGCDTKPELPRKKRRRLDDAALVKRRARLAQKKWEAAMKRPDRWRRCNENSQEAKQLFFDREQSRLNAFWAWCTKHFDERVFLS